MYIYKSYVHIFECERRYIKSGSLSKVSTLCFTTHFTSATATSNPGAATASQLPQVLTLLALLALRESLKRALAEP